MLAESLARRTRLPIGLDPDGRFGISNICQSQSTSQSAPRASSLAAPAATTLGAGAVQVCRVRDAFWVGPRQALRARHTATERPLRGNHFSKPVI